MEIEKLKTIRLLISEQISNSLNLVGSNELNLLCQTADILDKLIKYIENPEKQHLKEKKLERLIYGK